MRITLKRAVDKRIDKKIEEFSRLKFKDADGYWITEVNLHELIYAIIKHCQLNVRYTIPEKRKLIVSKSKSK